MIVGTRIGVYEVTGAIGAGGMGEVYRARDTKLQREVAIKVLPEPFANDRDRLARFEREAQSLAALNHPHIAQIYGVTENPPALVMEFVDGEDLSARIASGPLPIPEALALATQIAEAVEAAHERGIIHRDLKPANIKVADSGSVKVLDFGLAKALSPEVAATPAISNSPTFTSPSTQLGVILGTAAYMAPEQAKGKTVDRRADVWAFGGVLFEMLTGKRAFEGEDVTDVIASIMRAEPEWNALPPGTPAGIRKLLKRCLEKDRAKRLDSMAVARYEIQEALIAPSSSAVPAVPTTAPRSVVPLIAAGVVCALLATGITWFVMRPQPVDAPLVRGSLTPVPPDALSLDSFLSDVDISPDGTMIAFDGQRQGQTPQIFVRRLDEDAAVPLAGTSDGRSPLFSNDGRWISYRTGNEILKVPVIGGGTEVMCRRCAGGLRGATWLDDGSFVFTSPGGLVGLRILRPGAAEAEPLTVVNRDADERAHLSPRALPDGRGVLFTVENTNESRNVMVFDPRTKTTKLLVRGASMPQFAPSGHLVYASDGKLFAVAFDTATLSVTGAPTLVLDGVVTKSSGAANYAIARNGTLLYTAGAQVASTFLVSTANRDGVREPLPLSPGTYVIGRFSPDGQQAVFDSRSGDMDLWLWDFSRPKSQRRLTFARPPDQYPVWSRDGAHVYYSNVSPQGSAILRRRTDGTGESETVATLDTIMFPTAITPDDKTLLVHSILATKTRPQAIYTIAVGANATPQLLIGSPDGGAMNAHLSLDGKWIAYQLEKGSRTEIIVQPFPNVSSGRWQVSDWGSHPMFSNDELFYRDRERRLVSVKLRPGPLFAFDPPGVVLESAFLPGPGRPYDVTSDGKRFIVISETRAEQPGGRPLQLNFILNWTEHLKRLTK
jgi:serine/threonine-protein kinase